MKKLPTFFSVVALAAATFFASGRAHAQTFSNGTFTNSSVLSLAGTVGNEIYGADFGNGPDETVSHYSFLSDYSSDASNSDITLTGDTGTYGGFLNSTTTGDASFDAVVGSGDYGNNVGILTLNTLTAGTEYEALLLTADDRTSASGGGDVTITDNGLTSDSQNDAFPGGTGTGNQFEGGYITDTFTEAAGQTTHTFTVDGAYINAVLVEQVPATPTWALMGLGLGLLIVGVRNRRASAI
jgi:hypothetical protein